MDRYNQQNKNPNQVNCNITKKSHGKYTKKNH